MPELPEVERVRSTLSRHVLGLVVRGVEVRRPDVVRGRRAEADLLSGRAIVDIGRRGKQLALMSSNGAGSPGPCVCIHLGMTGSLRYVPPGLTHTAPPHTHLIWRLTRPSGDEAGWMLFTDPRRFGGVWTFASPEELTRTRWSELGADALTMRPGELLRRFGSTRRGIKAALLDQAVIAGLGNIYVDELLFTTGLHPLTPACRLDAAAAERMVMLMRRLLRRAIRRGGSSLRDYVDADGASGRYQSLHRVYGRADLPCLICGTRLRAIQVAGRTSVYCPRCQPRRRRRSPTGR